MDWPSGQNGTTMADDAPDVVSISTPPAPPATPVADPEFVREHERRLDEHERSIARHDEQILDVPSRDHTHPELSGQIDNLWSAMEALRDDLLDVTDQAVGTVPRAEERTQVAVPPPLPRPSERHPGGLF